MCYTLPMSKGKEYEFLAPMYDAVFEPFLRKMRETIVDKIPPQSRVLEVACGTGAQAVRMRRIDPEYTGVDLSADMLQKARKKRVNCIEADGRDLPFEGGEFDAATITLALHEMDPEVRNGIANELLRLLRPGGFLIVGDYTVPASSTPASGTLYGAFVRKGIHLIEYFAGGSHYKNYLIFMGEGGLRSYLAGFNAQAKVVEDIPFFRGNMAVVKLQKFY